MGWRIIKQPDGSYARFSDIVDDFTHLNMTREEAIQACADHDCDRWGAEGKVQRAEKNPKRFNQALRTIELIHGADYATKYDELKKDPSRRKES